MKYLPSAPLLAAAMAGRPRHLVEGCPYCLAGVARENHALCVSDADIADLFGIERSTPAKWRKGTQVRVGDAERYASALGLLDHEVWPELLERSIEANQRACAGCGGVFMPSRKDHRFCKPNCRQRTAEFKAAKRAKYATDPEYRASRLSKAKEHYSETQRAKSIKRRIYYLANREREIAAAAERRSRQREEAAA